MNSTAPVVLLTGLGLEILALRNHKSLPLKLSATIVSIGYLGLFIVYKPPGPFMNVWPLGMNIYCLAQRCWNYLWLSSPEEFHRVDGDLLNEDWSREKADQTSKEKARANIKMRHRKNAKTSARARHSFSDALDIALAFRGVGWSFEAKGLPQLADKQTSRLMFAFSQLQGALCQFLILDFAIAYANATYTSLESASFPARLMLGGIMLLYVRWTMDIPYRLVSVLSVLSGSSKPSAWTPMFGQWRDAFTIRRFWSHTWHQGMRLLAEPPMELVAHRWLQLQRGSYASKWCRFFGNFLIACLDHAYGRIIAGGDPKHDWTFFIVQPIAIWIEETARYGAVKCGVLDATKRSKVEMWLGYLWTAGFECWTFLYFMEGAIRVQGVVPADTLIEPAFGVSVFKSLLR